MRKMSSIFALFIIFSPLSARANPIQASSNIPIPDFDRWKIVNSSRIELTISDCASIYLGTEVEYVNPSDSDEFIRVVSRHIPLPVSKCRKYDQRSLSETATVLFNQRAEEEILEARSKESDPFLFIRWRTGRDLDGRNKLSGDVDVWLLPAEGLFSGSWLVFRNIKVDVEFLTENVGDGNNRNIFSGKKYTVGNSYHMVKVSRDDILRLLNGEDENEN
jgi:hypothetical protein